MSSYGSTYHTQSYPEQWESVSYTVRRPGTTAWAEGLSTYAAARKELRKANHVIPGHRIYAEQRYVGDLPTLQGRTRTVERGTF